MSKHQYKDIYERLLILDATDALLIIANDMKKDGPTEINNCKYRPKSYRYKLFIKKGVQCVDCGITANVGIFERHRSVNGDNNNNNNKWHWNFYYKEAGHERMMTIDHILPKSMGGSSNINNCQPMCDNCNNKKGNGKLCEDANVPFSIANQLSRDEISLIVQNSIQQSNLKMMNLLIDNNVHAFDDFMEGIISYIYNHFKQGHNEIPTNKKWKHMKTRLKDSYDTNKRMSEQIKYLNEQLLAK